MIFHWFLGIEDPKFKDCLLIRHKVFVNEQKVPLALEVDGLDPEMWQVVAYLNHQPIATARICLKESTTPITYKVQRVAVLKEYRGQNIGYQLMIQIEEKIDSLGGQRIVLSAQDQALDFYYKLGYSLANPQGYMDAGIPHHDMTKSI